jgi:hypothetical protein
MAEQQQAASFNPADASGLFDGGRALIKTVEVNVFQSGKGDKFVNVDVTYLTEGRDMTEHLMLGGVDKWAPLPDKSGAISIDNKKVWNKSDPYRWVTSLVNAGFPSNKVGQNLKVFEGLGRDAAARDDGREIHRQERQGAREQRGVGDGHPHQQGRHRVGGIPEERGRGGWQGCGLRQQRRRPLRRLLLQQRLLRPKSATNTSPICSWASSVVARSIVRSWVRRRLSSSPRTRASRTRLAHARP